MAAAKELVKELVVVSGKGGTGKTSLVAAFAALAQSAVLADCDVDAADLHLILDPRVLQRETFIGAPRARILAGHCVACGKCEELCRYDAIGFEGPGNGRVPRTFRVDPLVCEGCGVCAWFCAEKAIEFKPAPSGQWFVSETRHGLMVHAQLGAAEANSGRLVALVRERARLLADERGARLIIADGSPGIGCPVIASVTGASLVLILTEPTLSACHDLERVAQLASHFQIPTAVCINKSDLHAGMAEQIEGRAREIDLKIVGRIHYDPAFTRAQIRRQSIVEFGADSGAAADVRGVWEAVRRELRPG
jgi:MinD superfamily P-loop ATPase